MRVFQLLDRTFSPLVADLFTSRENLQIPRYFTRERDSQAEGINALHCNWPQGTLYAFPPVKLLPRVISKIQAERASVLLIAPHWPRRPWFWDRRELSILSLFPLPTQPDLVSQVPVLHTQFQAFHLHGWMLNGKTLSADTPDRYCP